MRIDNLFMQDLEALSLMDKVMAILTDVHEITKNLIEKKTNVLETFEIPFKSAFEEFFEKEGKPLKEKNPSYFELVSSDIFQQKLIEFSLGDKKTVRKEGFFKEAFSVYKELIEKKKVSSSIRAAKQSVGENIQEGEESPAGFITDEKVLVKVRDLIEFIYIYRFNQKISEDNTRTEELLKFLNAVYAKKYGENFLQKNMDLYQQIEQEIERLVEIPDKVQKIEELLKKTEWKTVQIFSIFYWLYARGEMNNLVSFLKEADIPDSFREYIIDLVLKRAGMKSKNEKIKESVKKSKDLIKEIISQLNDRVIPVISKQYFERLITAGVEFFPEYFKPSIVHRIKDNVYLYIKAEKIKNG